MAKGQTRSRANRVIIELVTTRMRRMTIFVSAMHELGIMLGVLQYHGISLNHL